MSDAKQASKHAGQKNPQLFCSSNQLTTDSFIHISHALSCYVERCLSCACVFIPSIADGHSPPFPPFSSFPLFFFWQTETELRSGRDGYTVCIYFFQLLSTLSCYILLYFSILSTFIPGFRLVCIWYTYLLCTLYLFPGKA